MPDIERIQGKSEGKPATKRAMRGVGAGGLETVELDVTPVMNLFLVLIPFLVSMAVFTHLAVVEFSLPPGVSPDDAKGQNDEVSNELDISIVITNKGYTIVGSGQKLPMIPKIDGKYNFTALEARLKVIKYNYLPSPLNPLTLQGPMLRLPAVCRVRSLWKTARSNMGMPSHPLLFRAMP